jgi:hypothetical protein
MSLLGRYTHWLHTRWPAGTVEKLPEIREDGTTAIPGVRIVGDLTGIPLLKFSSDSGARAIGAFLAEPDFGRTRGAGDPDVVDVAIVGGGVSGIAAAIEAKKAGLSFVVFEASEVFSTVANFPKGKPIYTYPTGMTPAGDLQLRSEVHPKEQLLADLESLRKKAGIDVTSARIERISRQDGILRLLDAHTDATLLLGVIGGQGFLLGRGNQQISAEVLRRVGTDNLVIVAAADKVAALDPPVLHVDLGDGARENLLEGYRKVRVAPQRSVVLRVSGG